MQRTRHNNELRLIMKDLPEEDMKQWRHGSAFTFRELRFAWIYYMQIMQACGIQSREDWKNTNGMVIRRFPGDKLGRGEWESTGKVELRKKGLRYQHPNHIWGFCFLSSSAWIFLILSASFLLFYIIFFSRGLWTI